MQLSKGKKIQQQWPDKDPECSIQHSWTDRGQQLTSICSQKQDKQELYLGSTAVGGCGVRQHTDKKQKWRHGNSHRNPNLWLGRCTAEVKTMAGCSHWELKQFSRQEQSSRKQTWPQDRINSTKSTTMLQAGCTLSDSSYHYLLTGQAALLKQPFQSTFTHCTKYKLLITVWKLFQQRHGALHDSRALGPPQNLQVVNLHDKQREKGTEPKSLLRLWLGNFCLEISTFPETYYRE